jgi:hypothetical protein
MGGGRGSAGRSAGVSIRHSTQSLSPWRGHSTKLLSGWIVGNEELGGGAARQDDTSVCTLEVCSPVLKPGLGNGDNVGLAIGE